MRTDTNSSSVTAPSFSVSLSLYSLVFSKGKRLVSYRTSFSIAADFWDPDTLEFKRKTAVTRLNGAKANNINELEYWRGRVIANVWFRDFLLVIDPESGMVEKEYDFTELWSSQERTIQGADVLNGISVSEDPNFLYLTGKYWDRMFLVRQVYEELSFVVSLAGLDVPLIILLFSFALSHSDSSIDS